MNRGRLAVVAIILLAVPQSGGAEQIQIRLEATDATGASVEEVQVGEEFRLNAFVSDIRDEPKGVYSAYVDVFATPGLVSIDSEEISHGEFFGSAAYAGTTSEAIINDTGSLSSSLDQYGSEERLLFQASVLAVAPGDVEFHSGADTLLPRRATALHGLNTAIPKSEFSFGSTGVTIVVPEPFSLCIAISALCLPIVRKRHR